jgi:hypothetical protein
MINSLDRLIEGIIRVLRADIIPHLADEYARGQAYSVIDLLQNLRLRIDWAVGPLRDQVEAQAALAMHFDRLWAGQALPPPPAPDPPEAPAATGSELLAQRDALDGHLCAVLRWLEGNRATLPAAIAAEAEAALRRYIHEQLQRDLRLTARPLFVDIARRTDASPA